MMFTFHSTWRRQMLVLGLAVFSCFAQAQHEADSHSPVVYAIPESNGLAQSPINIVTGSVVSAHHDIAVHYENSDEHLINTGHTLEADFEPGSYLDYDGVRYDLRQLHFHTPAEHLINGITYPMEVHLVHTQQNDPANYLVVGILFSEGRENDFLARVLDHAPRQAGEQYTDNLPMNALDMLEAIDGYYHYEGSLTTAPYSETVTWLLMKSPHEASAAQIEQLNLIEGDNARHIQSLHARRIEVE
ncbi:MAG: carbonic anhydrase family protein, partial [Pseudomonadales bacterium]|nr:carbonic anhydrase family protein [Pseudomonadales bacterium]